MFNVPLNRIQLAELTNNPQIIKAFEGLFYQVTTEQPNITDGVQATADGAASQAALALALVYELASQLATAMVTNQITPSEYIEKINEHIPNDNYIPPTSYGSLAEQNLDKVKITGGSIDGVSAGATTPLTYFRVIKPLAGEAARVEGDTNDVYSVINQTNSGGAARAILSLRKANSTVANISAGANGDAYYEAFGGSPAHAFYTAGVERARVDASGLKVANRLIIGDYSCLIQSTVAMFNGAGASAATLSNAPVAGNPTKWIPIIDNGVTRYIPAW